MIASKTLDGVEIELQFLTSEQVRAALRLNREQWDLLNDLVSDPAHVALYAGLQRRGPHKFMFHVDAVKAAGVSLRGRWPLSRKRSA